VTPMAGAIESALQTPASSEMWDICQSRLWRDQRELRVLGMGTALPGPPVSTADLLLLLDQKLGVLRTPGGFRWASASWRLRTRAQLPSPRRVESGR
jgi:hypothetical protein